MPQFYLKIDGKISLSDFSNIHDYVEFLNKDDKLTISFKSQDRLDGHIISTILEDKDFTILCNDNIENGKYSIKALKN